MSDQTVKLTVMSEDPPPLPAATPDGLSISATKGKYARCGLFQVVMTDDMKAELRAWLDGRGMYMYVVPVVDDLPTFGIGKAHGGNR